MRTLRWVVSGRLKLVLALQLVHRHRWVPAGVLPFLFVGEWQIIKVWVCPVRFTLMGTHDELDPAPDFRGRISFSDTHYGL